MVLDRRILKEKYQGINSSVVVLSPKENDFLKFGFMLFVPMCDILGEDVNGFSFVS